MDCLLGHVTGRPYIPWENPWFPVKISHRRGLHRLFRWLPWQQRFLLYELLQTLQNLPENPEESHMNQHESTWINMNQHEWWSIDGIDSKPFFSRRAVLHKNHVLAGPALSMVARGTCRRRLNNCWILFVYVAYSIRRRIWWSPSHLTFQNPKLAAHV
jgi:hypothetical protein